MRRITVLATLILALSSGIALSARDGSGAEHPHGPSLSDLRAAPDPSPGVELTAKRTETTRTYQLPDGRRLTRIYESPVDFRGSGGELKAIDGGLVQGDDGLVRNGEGRFDVVLPERLGVDPVRLSAGEDWVSSQLLGHSSKAVDVFNTTATYEGLTPGADAKLSTFPGGVKEEIVIADPSQPNRFEFELRSSPGLMPELTGKGSIEFRDSDGVAAFILPAPVMFDSTRGLSALSTEVRYELQSQEGGGWRLAVHADREWLEAEERVWPVRIDPTLHVPAPALDCSFGWSIFNYEGVPFCASSGYQSLWVSDQPGEYPSQSRALLRFSLATIPSTAAVTAATFGLHAPGAAVNTSGVEMRRATKGWTSQVNWLKYNGTNNWSKAGGDYASDGGEILTAERGSQAGWWSFSQGMAPLVQKWISGAYANQGVLVKPRNDPQECWSSEGYYECLERYVTFESSAAPDQEKRPYLDVTYYPPAPATSKVISPSEGQKTSRRLKLKTAWVSGVTGVTFQFREADSEPFQTIPTNLVRDANGQQVTWPLAVQGSPSEPVYFDAAHASESLTYQGGSIQIRALFEGPPGIGGYSVPAKATVDRFIGAGKDATAELGPGSLNLLTGNFTVSRTDVSLPSFGSDLEFSRSHNSRNNEYSSKAGVLGPGWKPTIPVEAAGGSAWQKLVEYKATQEEVEYGLGDYALLTDLEGYEFEFEKSGSDYVSPPYAKVLQLSRQDSTHLAVSDIDGNRTVFTKNGSADEYLPTEISQTGGVANRTRMVYSTSGAKRLTKVIAPTPADVTCNESTATTTAGCRVLTFTYKPATTWGAPSSYGERLYGITFHAHPASATEVARYSYNSSGQLTEAWDPRISPALKETYAYTYWGSGILKTITPPGEEPWTLEYGALAGEFANGRLMKVKRPSLVGSPSVAQTTIVYDVPVTGEGAPHDMSGSQVSQWGQADVPTDATAIFPADQIPSNPPSSYSRATIHYLDPEGMQVNEALPAGAGISSAPITTTETDEHGNVVRELSAQNRLRALAVGAESLARSHELETRRVFSADGLERSEEWGPLHETRLKSGETVQARLHTTIQYDEKAPTPPAGTPMPHLPTRETVGAIVSGQGGEFDQRVTETEYDWTLRQPTAQIVDPGGLNLKTRIVYDSTSGLPTERRLPANPEGGDARTTKILYYTAGAHPVDSACASKAAWANLPCKVSPAAQPGTPGQPPLSVTKYSSYNSLGQPTEITRSPGGGAQNAHTIKLSYNAVGREQQRWESQGLESLRMPTIVTTYDPNSGRPTVSYFQNPQLGCEENCDPWDEQAVSATYDTLGRVTTFRDADGNISSTSYDLLGRPVTTSDGKGIQTRTYDPTSGLLVKLEDSGAGTFTGSYDADGNLTENGLPNGLTAQTTYDEAGAPVHLEYEKTSGCSLECTWLEFDVEESIHGQWLRQESTISTQEYGYDAAGRLTLAKDTPQGGGCTTRSYGYDKNSNREALVTRAPGIGGVCDVTSQGAVQTYSYDKGDRLLGSGIAYDDHGRITSLPSAFSGGGTLNSTYYNNDLIKSQSQDGITNAYGYDAALRQRQRTQTGGPEPGTEIYHYADGSDSPAWIDRGSSWERSIAGIDGDLAAIQHSSKGTTLHLGNLHGDIVAIASLDPEATEPLETFEFDEFGNPKGEATPKYGWLGGKQRRTELPSGVIQMGTRSYVPAVGRFISVDPIAGGSANAYEYGMADPVNNFDHDGLKKKKKQKAGLGNNRRVRVGGSSTPSLAKASNVTMKAVKKVIRKIRQFVSNHLRVAWNSCIPQTELSFSRRTLLNLFGGTCIPKVRDYIYSPPEIAVSKVNGWSWCALVNTYGSFGNILSYTFAALKSGSFCSGNDGERPWAYVKYDPIGVPNQI